MRLLHILPTLAALAALSAAAADQGATLGDVLLAPEDAAESGGASQPEGDHHPMAVAVAELEKERDEIIAASETAINELKAQLTAVAAERDAAQAEAATLAGKLKKAEAKLAKAPPAADPTPAPGDDETPRGSALAGPDYIVMATSQVGAAGGGQIARGRVATGSLKRLEALVAEGKARYATVSECEAAERRTGIARVAD